MKSTYEITGNFLKEDKKKIFNELYLTINGKYGEVAETIAEFLRDCSTTFVSDIASKYLRHNNCSEKQAWCMVFEAIKIAHMYESWVESEIEKIKEFEANN
jgi:hypothetical protein